jgi:hypothetical protein
VGPWIDPKSILSELEPATHEAKQDKQSRTAKQDSKAGQQSRTSMIGNSQGEAEIPHDLAEGVLPTGKVFA